LSVIRPHSNAPFLTVQGGEESSFLRASHAARRRNLHSVYPMKNKFHFALCAVLFVALPACAAQLPARVTWIGNSYPGGDGRHVPQDIDALCVTPDGRVFSNVFWEEGGGNVTEFKDGQVIGKAGHTHGWGATGGKAIACNSKYLFIAGRMHNEGGGLKDESTWPVKGKLWIGISRRPLNDITKPAPFENGKGGKGDTLKGAFLVVNEVDDNDKAQDISGLAGDEKRLYVSSPADGTIKIFDAETMARLAEWKTERPGPIALAKDGTLWMLQTKTKDAAARLIHLDRTGKVLPHFSEFEATANPVSIAPTPNGNIAIVDQGPRQQIRFVSATGIGSPFTIGLKGGIYSKQSVIEVPPAHQAGDQGHPHDIIGPLYQTVARGTFGDLRFNNPSAAVFDAAGNIYLAQRGSSGGGSTVLESYDKQNKLRWRLFGLNFVDMADVDPTDDTQIYTKEERFQYDYSKTGPAAWTYEAYTVNPLANPQDPRLHIWSAGVWMRRLPFNAPTNQPPASNSQEMQRLYTFVLDMNAEYLQVFSSPRSALFSDDDNPILGNDAETFYPIALFSKKRINKDGWPPHQPAKGEWIWRSKNSNGAFDADEFESRESDAPPSQGWWVDNNGGIWLVTEKQGLRYFPCKIKNGGPHWSYATMQTFPHAGEFDEVKRVRYDAKTDTLYLGGTKGADRNQHWKPMGPVIARYDNWLKGDKKLRWQITAPYQKGSAGHESCEPMGFDVAGDYVFVPYTGAGRQIGFKTGHIEVFRADNGASVGWMEPGADIGEIGLQDIRECLRAHKRADGEYIVFLEEDYKAKILMYRWKP
jgi:hypothetical protein